MNQIARQTNGTAVATQDDNPFLSYGRATSQSTIVGELLKFSKGEWTCGKNDTEVPEGTQMVAIMDQLLTGWIKWVDGKPAEQEMGLVAEGYRPPRRSDLGDTDKGEWETDLQGAPKDPWQFTNYLLMKDISSGEVYTFTTSSRGGINAIGKLAEAYGKNMRAKPDQFPVVALEVDSYKHSNKAFGKIFVPVLTVSGWMAKAEALEGIDGAESADNEPAPTAKKGGGKPKAAPAEDDVDF